MKQNNFSSLKMCTIHVKLGVENKPKGGIFVFTSLQLSCVAWKYSFLCLWTITLVSSVVSSLEPNIWQDVPPWPRSFWWSCVRFVMVIVSFNAEKPYSGYWLSLIIWCLLIKVQRWLWRKEYRIIFWHVLELWLRLKNK